MPVYIPAFTDCELGLDFGFLNHSRYLPGRPFETVQIAEILDAVRVADERSNAAYHRLPAEPGIERIMGGIERAMDEALAGRTAKDLALGEHDMPATEPPAVDQQGASRGTG